MQLLFKTATAKAEKAHAIRTHESIQLNYRLPATNKRHFLTQVTHQLAMQKKYPLLFLSFLLLLITTNCTSTRVENGVQIQKSRSYNLMEYLPW